MTRKLRLVLVLVFGVAVTGVLLTGCRELYGPSRRDVTRYFVAALNADDPAAILSHISDDSPLQPVDYADVRAAFPDTDFEIDSTYEYSFRVATVDGQEVVRLPIRSTTYPGGFSSSSPGRVYLLDMRLERTVGESNPVTPIYRIYGWEVEYEY